MKDRLSDEQNEAILKALNDAISQGPWEKSNFLRVIGKNLTEIRDTYINQLGERSASQIRAETTHATREAQRSGQQEVFVSLYSADGSNLQTWERIVANLPRQMISRPIYANEEDIISALKMKENKINEAYVAIFINQSDILSLSSDKAAVDKLGKPLLSLKDKTLVLENISRFVHMSSIYHFEQGRLKK